MVSKLKMTTAGKKFSKIQGEKKYSVTADLGSTKAAVRLRGFAKLVKIKDSVQRLTRNR